MSNTKDIILNKVKLKVQLFHLCPIKKITIIGQYLQNFMDKNGRLPRWNVAF